MKHYWYPALAKSLRPASCALFFVLAGCTDEMGSSDEIQTSIDAAEESSRWSWLERWRCLRRGDCDDDRDQPPTAGSGGDDPPTPEPEPEPDPDPDDDHHMHGDQIPASELPTGSSGSGEVRVRSTSEVPGPGDGTGMFRTVCGFSHMNYDDPIVFPGQPGRSHLHAYFGNTEADAHSTGDSLMNSGNSTCRGGIINRSSYWVPAMTDRNGTPIKPREIMVYYKTGYNGVRPRDVQPFPTGLRMVAGAIPGDRSTQPSRHSKFMCESTHSEKHESIPTCRAGDRLVMVVEFPQCWDGENLDSPDHRSHMAYPRGGCPSSHPVALSEVSFNVSYDVSSGDTSAWRLVSDSYDESQPGGLSAHADWFAAWDEEIAEEWVRECNNAAKDCHAHLLGPYRAIY